MLKHISKFILLNIGLLTIATSLSFAAETESESVTIFITNEATRAIKQMTSFQTLNITAADRDQGYSELRGNNLIIQSNDTYKIQGKITGNTLDALMQIDSGDLKELSSSYTDLYDEGAANNAAEHPISLRFGVNWQTSTLTENVTLHLKVLSRT